MWLGQCFTRWISMAESVYGVMIIWLFDYYLRRLSIYIYNLILTIGVGLKFEDFMVSSFVWFKYQFSIPIREILELIYGKYFVSREENFQIICIILFHSSRMRIFPEYFWSYKTLQPVVKLSFDVRIVYIFWYFNGLAIYPIILYNIANIAITNTTMLDYYL